METITYQIVESGKHVTGEKFCMSVTAVTNAVKHVTLQVIFATIAKIWRWRKIAC